MPLIKNKKNFIFFLLLTFSLSSITLQNTWLDYSTTFSNTVSNLGSLAENLYDEKGVSRVNSLLDGVTKISKYAGPIGSIFGMIGDIQAGEETAAYRENVLNSFKELSNKMEVQHEEVIGAIDEVDKKVTELGKNMEKNTEDIKNQIYIMEARNEQLFNKYQIRNEWNEIISKYSEYETDLRYNIGIYRDLNTAVKNSDKNLLKGIVSKF